MSPSGWLEELRSIDIHELGTHNIGSGRRGQGSAGVLVMILVLALGYSFSTSEVQSQLDLKREEETALKEQFATKAHMAANLELYPATERDGKLFWCAAAATAQ
jgi:type IV pilus assembly protein PilO